MPSEAFIVKQNGDIRYMADVKIMFFDEGIKKVFSRSL